MFPTRTGRTLDPKRLNVAFDKIQLAAGVRRRKLYDARHTAASLLLAEGVPTRVVMEVLGHKNMATTTDTYMHVMPSMLAEAADAMQRVYGGALSGQLSGQPPRGDRGA